MRKIMCLFLFVAIATTAVSQELHVTSGGTVFVSPKSFVYVHSDINVDGAGNFTVASDATDSGSLLFSGTNPTGNISYNRYVPTAKWHFVSAPVKDQSISDFAANINNDVKLNDAETFYGISYYDNSNDVKKRWRYYTDGVAFDAATSSQSGGPIVNAGNFILGRGYSNLRASVGTYTFTGGLETTDVTLGIAENNATALGHRVGVVGNPYPAFLPANTTANALNNVLTQNINNLAAGLEALYFWDGTTDQYTPVNNSLPAFYLAPGQAFMLAAKADGEQFTFSKTNAVPQPTSTDRFYKAVPLTEVEVMVRKDKLTKKTTLRYLDNNATLGFDRGYDAGAYRDGEPSFSIDTHLVSNSTGMDFTLQCLPKSLLETTVVPLAIYAQANEEISFEANTKNLPDGVYVFLEDKATNTITKISETSYTITLDEQQKGIGRFYLHTSANGVLSVDDINDLNNISLYTTNNQNLRIVGLQNAENTEVKMYSLQGKQVLSTSFIATNVNDVALPRLSKGVYLVNVVSNANTHTKKIILE